MSRSRYTLPVFACAAAVAALHWLHDRQPLTLGLIVEPIFSLSGLNQIHSLSVIVHRGWANISP
ncbi:hypothetical protein [Nostoc sphaeroides]|uniref:Catalyze the methylation of C-1 in cobalt-precorrin-5 n=1 Tax=Nostoc sphaeroides CCNUC1 TaxID=2653204 RepID=A0A5P8VWF0_9NOSO|nr:catalyze the methylation of C-1 in cobalt-precorrin-5 [Nostoc sphaeroides CCNUC1]